MIYERGQAQLGVSGVARDLDATLTLRMIKTNRTLRALVLRVWKASQQIRRKP